MHRDIGRNRVPEQGTVWGWGGSYFLKPLFDVRASFAAGSLASRHGSRTGALESASCLARPSTSTWYCVYCVRREE